jgi:hypothetical protein
MNLSRRSFQEVIGHMPWWLVAVVVGVMTVAFGALYYILGGLKSSDPSEPISFLACVYFSIVSESTLGDGTITPHGVARAVVSIQVLFGLLTAGILVAKIVSAPSAAAARIARMVEGEWVDCLDSDGDRVLGRTSLYSAANGLCFQGTDFLGDGTRGAGLFHTL